MGTLFKRRDRGGRSGNWYAQFTDEHGNRTVPKSTGTSDKEAAKRILAKWEADAALRRTGVIDTAAERIADQRGRPIREHISEFRASLQTPGNTDEHVDRTVKIVEGASKRERWETLADITLESAERYAQHLRGLDRSGRTIHKHLGALKQFTKWAHETKRFNENPLISLQRPSPDSDRKLQRRSLHPDEWPHLKAVISQERALLYETAIQTGLRQNEMRELTAGKLHLDKKPPFVTLPSRSTKNKKPARQYVSAALARRLQAQARKSPSPLFALPHETDVAEMVRRDLAAARSQWIDAAKSKRERTQRERSDFLASVDHEGHVFDFQALRHTCGAWLAMDGENPKTIQTIMRHSTITLTMDTYGHLFPATESAAIARLGRKRFGG